MKLKKIFMLLNSANMFIMIILAAVLFVTLSNVNEDIKWVTHTHEVINRAEGLMTNMVNQQTGMRGFLATGNQSYLEPYNNALVAFDDELGYLKNAVSENPGQVERLIEIERLSKQWHSEAAGVYLTIKNGILRGHDKINELHTLTTSGLGKQKMDLIRQLLMQVEDETLRLNVLNSMINMETGVRAYIINKEEVYLEPYYLGQTSIDAYLDIIHDHSLHVAIHDWIENIGEKEIQLVKKSLEFSTEEELRLEISKGTGKYLMDEIRHEVDEFIEVEKALLVERNKDLRWQYHVAFMMIALSVIMVVGVGIFQNTMIKRVTKPLSQFTKMMQSFDPSHIDDSITIDNKSVYEVSQLAISYEKLLKELQTTQEERDAINVELSRLTRTDQLTGILNRRGFDETLDLEWRRGNRNQKYISLLMIDIDFFKNYNDTYGHVAGDKCLKQVAKTISDLLQRPFDSVARYGGEEFVVLLPETNTKGGKRVAERIRKAIEGLNIENRGNDLGDTLTISIGISTIRPTSEDGVEILVTQSDEALYKAKQMGRNRCVVYESKLTK